jgi:uncharacterized protein YjbJ (UPF0337 family)
VEYWPPVQEKLLNREEYNMKQSTQDRAAGKVHVVTGKFKEAAGRVTKNPNLEAEGTVEKVGGKVQNLAGRIEKAVGK